MSSSQSPLKVLALETSAWGGSVALLHGYVGEVADGVDSDSTALLVADGILPPKSRTAAGLSPLIQSLLEQAGWKPMDVDLVAVTTGPGSFTGLRTGVTTAKVFAYAAQSQVLDVDTLHAIAFGCETHVVRNGANDAGATRLSVVMDAQRKELFRAEFVCENGTVKPMKDCQIVDGQSWLDGLDVGNKTTRVAGPGLTMKLVDGRTVEDDLRARCCKDASGTNENIIVTEDVWRLTAETVGRLAVEQYGRGRRSDLWKLSPAYHRLSAAEEKAAENKK